ncbi:MAG: siroheme synthase CysG [Pseudoruegeria sp.]
MQHFPIFLAVAGRKIALSGGGAAAVAKVRLLLKTEAHIFVYAPNPVQEIADWADAGKLTLLRRDFQADDAIDTALFYAANEDDILDTKFAALAKTDGAMVNIVDNLADSEFLTPAIVDRDPVTIAIGTEGAAPVLARAIKRDLEERLPAQLGVLAKIGKSFRASAKALPFGRARRDFWSSYYFAKGPAAIDHGTDAVKTTLYALLNEHLGQSQPTGHVDFVGAGPGDPELLTLKARNALHEADVVLHDRLVPSEILELARREAAIIEAGKTGFGQAMSQSDINALIIEHASLGAQVVRLKSGDPTVFGRLDEEIDALNAASISWRIVPGITAASAAVAAIGQSLTKRDRNGSVRLLTAHDMQGFAEHDWKTLARPGTVAAIYMGKTAARFIQGRLLMHGAAADTPVTLIENASQPSQRILATTLAELTTALAETPLTGPALTLYGLAPRAALDLAETLNEKEFA